MFSDNPLVDGLTIKLSCREKDLENYQYFISCNQLWLKRLFANDTIHLGIVSNFDFNYDYDFNYDFHLIMTLILTKFKQIN